MFKQKLTKFAHFCQRTANNLGWAVLKFLGWTTFPKWKFKLFIWESF